MSYQSIAEMTESMGLRRRIAACAAQEFNNANYANNNPMAWVDRNVWIVCAAPGWDAQWDSGKVAYPNEPDIGVLSDVITDGNILASVQPLVLAEVPAQGEELPA